MSIAIRPWSNPSGPIVISDADFEINSERNEDFGIDETSSFVSETSQELASESSDYEQSDETVSISSLRSVSSVRKSPTKPARNRGLRRVCESSDKEQQEVIEISEYSSYDSYYSSSEPKPVKQNARNFQLTQASLGDFIEDDESYEEDQMNSEDRAFIASSQSSTAKDSIAMYRLLDKSQPWRPFYISDSSEC